jgi:hypothetical protein
MAARTHPVSRRVDRELKLDLVALDERATVVRHCEWSEGTWRVRGTLAQIGECLVWTMSDASPLPGSGAARRLGGASKIDCPGSRWRGPGARHQERTLMQPGRYSRRKSISAVAAARSCSSQRSSLGAVRPRGWA